MYCLRFFVGISDFFEELDHSVQVERGDVIAQCLLPLVVGFSEKVLHCLCVRSKNRLSLDFSDRGGFVFSLLRTLSGSFSCYYHKKTILS